MQKILVTGSQGFIGQETVRFLRTMGFKVYTLDILDGDEQHFKCDITSDLIESIIQDTKPEIVVHLAAQVNVSSSMIDPFSDLKTNILGTLKVLTACISGNVNEFIYVGSGGAIYSSSNQMPVSEEGSILPVSPYGISKFAAEGYVRVLSELHGMGWTSLALSNCYGNIEFHRRGVVYEFFKKISAGQSPTINGAEVTRDFIHVHDVASAIYLAIGHPANKRLNISSNSEITLKELFNEIASLTNSSVSPSYFPPREGDVLRSRLDNSRAQQMLNWSPKINLSEGLKMNLNDDGQIKW